MSEITTRATARKQLRDKANRERHAANIERDERGEPRPWQAARAARATRRLIDPEVISRRKAHTKNVGTEATAQGT